MLPPDELTRDQPKQETFLFKKGAAGDAAYIVHSGSCSPAMMSPAATSLPTPTYSARAAFAP
jgi:hypothetical protein